MTLEDLKNTNIKDIDTISKQCKTGCIDNGIVSLYDLLVYDQNILPLPSCKLNDCYRLNKLRITFFCSLDEINKFEIIGKLIENKFFPIYDILDNDQKKELDEFYSQEVKKCENVKLKLELNGRSCKNFISKYAYNALIKYEQKYPITYATSPYVSALKLILKKYKDFIVQFFAVDRSNIIKQYSKDIKVEKHFNVGGLYTLNDLKNIDINSITNLSHNYKIGCIKKNILTLYDIMVYDKCFLDIPNCGRKGCDILDKLRIETFKSLKDNEKSKIINSIIENRNFPIYNILDENSQHDIDILYKMCIDKCMDQNLKHILSSMTCKIFINTYRYGDKSLMNLKFQKKDSIFVSEFYKILNGCIDYILNCFNVNVESSSTNIFLFKEVQNFIENKLDNTSRNIKIFLHSYDIIESYKYIDTRTLAEAYSITLAYVTYNRQLCYKAVFDDFGIFTQFLKKQNWNVYIDRLLKDKNYITKDDIADEYKNIKNEENCNLTLSFVLYILYRVSDQYRLFSKYTIENFDSEPYLMKQEFVSVIDISKCKETIEGIFKNNIRQYDTNLTKFIMTKLNYCVSPSWIEYEYDVKRILKTILSSYPYFVVFDIDDSFTIPISKQLKFEDIIYQILKDNGEKMHVDDICIKFSEYYPSKKISVNQIKSAVGKSNSIVSIGRTRYYGLSEWNLHTNTIRDDVVDFLNQKETPQTINAIYEYVISLGTTTNKRSLRSSISSDNRFIMYEEGLFGLQSKKYSFIYEKQLPTRKTFEEHLSELELFIRQRHTFPSTYEPKVGYEEASLGRWWYRVCTNTIIIPENLKDRIIYLKGIENQYNEGLNIEGLESFIIKYSHIPWEDSQDDYEKNLYAWIQTQVSDNNNELILFLQKYKVYNITKEEFEWQSNYKKYEDYINKNHKIPTKENGEEKLEQWFNEFKETYETSYLDDEKVRKYINIIKLRCSIK